MAREIQRILNTRNQMGLRDELLRSRGAKSSTWPAGTANPCHVMFEPFANSGRETTVLSNLARWRNSPTHGERRGVNFSDRYYDVRPWGAGTGRMMVERRPQARENDSYTYVTFELHFRPPGGAVRDMDPFLRTAVAGSSGALEMSLAQNALATTGERLQEVIIVLVGPGGEGKTLLTVTLGVAARAAGHAGASSPLLQAPEEFRRQGYLLAQLRWISFDESKPNSTLAEGIFKMIAGGGRIA